MQENGKKVRERVRSPSRVHKFEVFVISLFVINSVILCDQSMAYPRYKNDAGEYGSNCSECHGWFTSSNSPKGTIFPSGDKHLMHRGASYMNTNCDLCHTTGDNRNPYLGSSNGTTSNPGLGCSGCHGRYYDGIGVKGVGLRAHHNANGITVCYTCHTSDPVPLPEEVTPPYYGTPDTLVDDTCNNAPDYLENWSIGDLLGLDNDGDNVYDECVVMDHDGDGILDDCDIDQNPGAIDLDGNGIIDICECNWANIDGLNPVNILDFSLFAADWGQIGDGLTGDANSNGIVDIEDLTLIARFWLADCL